ncbi:MAG: MazG family protein [Alkalispirochaeta sp.]
MSDRDHPELRANGSPKNYVRHGEADVFRQYAAIIRRLRADDGCPWDRKQTLHSLRRFIVEEAFELLAAINNLQNTRFESSSGSGTPSAASTSNDHAAVADELGDVFLVSLLLADALEFQSGVSLETILVENGRKLIRRHPHVFGSANATTAEEVVTNWNQIKEHQEGRSPSVAHVSRGLPPLERAFEMQKKASKVGFDWDSVEPALEKLKEEIVELERGIAEAKIQSQPTKDNRRIEEELGDVIFSAVNVSRHLKTDPSLALSHTNEKFLTRFRYIEAAISAQGMKVSDASLKTLDKLWEEAKTRERRI